MLQLDFLKPKVHNLHLQKTSLLTRLIDLATKKQAVHAMRVWTVLLQMVSKVKSTGVASLNFSGQGYFGCFWINSSNNLKKFV